MAGIGRVCQQSAFTVRAEVRKEVGSIRSCHVMPCHGLRLGGGMYICMYPGRWAYVWGECKRRSKSSALANGRVA